VADQHGAVHAEQGRAAELRVVHAARDVLEGDRVGTGHDLGEHAEDHLADALGGLEHDVADETVGKRHLAAVTEELLDVADEVHVRIAQQRGGLLRQLGALGVLLADRHERDARVLLAPHLAVVVRSHHRVLLEMVRAARGVGAAVHEQRDPVAVARRHRHRDARASDALQALELHRAGGDGRAGGAGGDDRLGLAFAHQAAGDEDRGVGPLLDRLDRALAHGDRVGSVDDAKVVRGAALRLEFGFEALLTADEQDLERALAVRGRQGPGDHLVGSMVPTHRVDRDPNHAHYSSVSMVIFSL
jgi:hypothetical protein